MGSKSKIYTKTGDGGETSLFGGERVAKNNLRIACVGTGDELNASLGIVVANLNDKELSGIIEEIQNKIFEIGSEIANPSNHQTQTTRNFNIKEADIEKLENLIDKYDSLLPELENFILPGGSIASAQLHLSRSICRRLERLLVKLSKKEAVQKDLLKFFNRLSDLLFILARTVNFRLKIKDKIWKK